MTQNDPNIVRNNDPKMTQQIKWKFMTQNDPLIGSFWVINFMGSFWVIGSFWVYF
jgi:hypothetical protein